MRRIHTMLAVYVVVIFFITVIVPFIPSLAMDMMAMTLVEKPEDEDG